MPASATSGSARCATARAAAGQLFVRNAAAIDQLVETVPHHGRHRFATDASADSCCGPAVRPAIAARRCRCGPSSRSTRTRSAWIDVDERLEFRAADERFLRTPSRARRLPSSPRLRPIAESAAKIPIRKRRRAPALPPYQRDFRGARARRGDSRERCLRNWPSTTSSPSIVTPLAPLLPKKAARQRGGCAAYDDRRRAIAPGFRRIESSSNCSVAVSPGGSNSTVHAAPDSAHQSCLRQRIEARRLVGERFRPTCQRARKRVHGDAPFRRDGSRRSRSTCFRTRRLRNRRRSIISFSAFCDGCISIDSTR